MGELISVDPSLATAPPQLNGRAVAIARRQALSGGKTALPPPTERVRTGQREASIVTVAAPAAMPPAATPIAPAAAAPAPAPAPARAQAVIMEPAGSQAGRLLSMQRRRLMAAGKEALKAAAAMPAQVISAAVEGFVASPVAGALGMSGAGRDIARARRAAMAESGRGSAPAAGPSRPPRQGTIEYPAKVVPSATQSGQSVTGLRIGQGARMTGDERGVGQPVSGTQYLPADQGAAFRASVIKVGVAGTPGGQVVTGTLVRSAVRITGDEAGQKVAITGEVDQRPDHDLTARREFGGSSGAQFARQANPHGTSVFGTNLGRSMKTAGSRDRERSAPVEATERGMVITGSALGRSTRVTGDEGGACRAITGTQYLAPARRQAACGAIGGGTAPAAQIGQERPDPVTAAKVAVSQSWGGQRVTGPNIEHNPLVTGDEPGSCGIVTGSQYQGPATAAGWCAAPGAQAVAQRMVRRPSDAPVTGNTPLHVSAVTGTARGAGRDITGTPYYRNDAETQLPGDPVAAVDSRFSIRTPQRSAQLVAGQGRDAAPPPAERITGSFAVGTGKITGNLEFLARPRGAGDPDRKPAHMKVSGEGTAGRARRMTGDSWERNALVTGQEAAFAAERNPTERGPKAKPFAGSTSFKQQANHEEARQLVTGMMGYFNKSGARVTLSGGAQS